jgi:hypothetical protein
MRPRRTRVSRVPALDQGDRRGRVVRGVRDAQLVASQHRRFRRGEPPLDEVTHAEPA